MAKATVDLNVEAGVDYAMTMVFQPYPRTRLTEYAIEQGLFDGDYETLGPSYYEATPLRQRVAGDELRLAALQRLFALAVEFPEVRRALDWLVEHDRPRLYAKAFELWHHHNFYRRFYGGRPLSRRQRPRASSPP